MSSNNYEIEQDSMEAEYGDDILYIGWNPEVDSVRQQLQLEPATKQPAMSAEPTTEVAELFLRKMYSFQC
jgi:hypothetical protein